MVNIDETVRSIFDLFREHGSRGYIGEAVSQTEHMVQSAMLAEEENQPTPVILGALFHDIGHLMAYGRVKTQAMVTDGVNLGVQGHECVGADFLREKGLGEDVCRIVRGHVDAKRYLVFADKEYHAKLSPSSQQTLKHQGGPMTGEEAENFRQEKWFDAMIRMRHWDDLAKRTDIEMKPLEVYEKMCREYLADLHAESK